MNARFFFLMLLNSCMSVFLISCNPPQNKEEKTSTEVSQALPNIIFILADDLGYGDLQCYNADSKIPTPHLDKMAREGMRFMDAHTPSSVCSPTRYGLLTGQYSWRGPLKKGVLQSFDLPIIADSIETFAEVLKKGGYHTAHFGKWHLGYRWKVKNGLPEEWPINKIWKEGEYGENIDLSEGIVGGPMDVGFDYSFGFDGPNFPPYCFWENEKIVGKIPNIVKPDSLYGNKGLMQKDWKLEEVFPNLEQKALDYIAKQAGQKQPFFVYFALTAPHVPLLPTKASQGKSQAGIYGDFVVDVDALVGKVRQQLIASGLAENTLLIFTSDNGSPARVEDPQKGRPYAAGSGEIIRQFDHKANGDLRGLKGDAWEGGHRVPMIIAWPQEITGGSTNEQTVCLIDWVNFAYQLTGQEKPNNQGIDSYDLMKTIKDPNQAIREHIVHHSARGKFAIRQGDWKLILTKGAGSSYSAWFDPDGEESEFEGQLYNLKDDPAEQNNLYGENPKKVNELTTLLESIKEGKMLFKP